MLKIMIVAVVLSVYDGDTFKVAAEVWPDVMIEASVRVLGIDTPEMAGRCESERVGAVKAKIRTADLVRDGVVLSDISHDKYAGRVLAQVLLPDGSSLADILIEEGLARPYDGGRRESWCP